MHAPGECSFARHGTYERCSPPGTRIPRWYCPQGHCTFSLLADCFAARLTGTLVELEATVDQVEQARTLEDAVAELRVEIGLELTRLGGHLMNLLGGVHNGKNTSPLSAGVPAADD